MSKMVLFVDVSFNYIKQQISVAALNSSQLAKVCLSLK